jgi:hypothetical protein
MENLEEPSPTDANGAAVVFYFACWAGSSANGDRGLHHKPRGKIVVEMEGYEPIELDVQSQ